MSTKAPQRLFDPQCFDLARYFLAGEPHDESHVTDLAAVIQDAVEDWLSLLPKTGEVVHV